MWNRIRFAFTFGVPFILLLVSGSGPVATAKPSAPTYTIIDLGIALSDTPFSLDINARGQVMGNSQTADGDEAAFLWEPGSK